MTDADRELIKREIRGLFNDLVRGKKADLTGYNARHDGSEGDWLTRAMKLTVNGRNEPDLLGFEMKKDSPKTTFGDWSPSTSLFKGRGSMGRDAFLRAFGAPSTEPRKLGRYSWSGTVFPKVGTINEAGQTIVIEGDHDVVIRYYNSRDRRRAAEVPSRYRFDKVELARWRARDLKARVEKKFNQLGWFKCIKDSSGVYTHIQFGRPITFDAFMKLFGAGDIIIDCGMYSGNMRPYMQWRASKRIWDQLAEK